MKKILITTAIALLCFSCSSKKITTTAIRNENSVFEKTVDSTSTKQVVKEVKSEPILADTAKASVAVAAIENLPEGAKFTEKSGRASVQLIRINDTIIITAICDSLQRLIYSYELEIENYNKKIEQKTDENQSIETTFKQQKNAVSTLFFWFITGAAIGAAAVLILSKKTSIITTIFDFVKKIFTKK